MLFREQEFLGSDIVIEQTLAPGSNYDRYYASYFSEGLGRSGLLTVPRGEKEANQRLAGDYLQPRLHPAQPVQAAPNAMSPMFDGFATSGYIVFRPDYHGHDRSEGAPTGAYGSPGYVVNVLNAVASMKRFPDADPERIGMWGHSIGSWVARCEPW